MCLTWLSEIVYGAGIMRHYACHFVLSIKFRHFTIFICLADKFIPLKGMATFSREATLFKVFFFFF